METLILIAAVLDVFALVWAIFLRRERENSTKVPLTKRPTRYRIDA